MNTTINNIQFINVWVDAVNKGAGVQAVADKLGVTIGSASAKASNLRTKGVNVPSMPRQRQYGDNVDDLNALIERKLVVKA